jgi:hypothetical protein
MLVVKRSNADDISTLLDKPETNKKRILSKT